MRDRIISRVSAAACALLVLLAVLCGCSAPVTNADATAETTADATANATTDDTPTRSAPSSSSDAIDEDGTYTSKDDVALYIHTYGHLPDNFVTKEEAEDAGWKTEGLDIDEACPGKSIGGGWFGNYEGKLPRKKGRTWHECDIDYRGGSSRGPKRIVYSNDGLIYYTKDHYESFERLY